jgi:23S rRNA (uridine2552-2'-O)-methyltransferase
MTYRRKDAYHRRARAAGYRARSAYKLVELDRRFGLLGRGDVVVDLGAWPGAWLQVVLERIGDEGFVVGVDLAAIEPLPAGNVRLVKGDVREPTTVETIRSLLPRPADVVLSDLAAKLTGVRATDEARASELGHATLALLPGLLRPGGRLLMKAFMSPDLKGLQAAATVVFDELRTTRPEATRQGSAELYLAARGHRVPPSGR